LSAALVGSNALPRGYLLPSAVDQRVNTVRAGLLLRGRRWSRGMPGGLRVPPSGREFFPMPCRLLVRRALDECDSKSLPENEGLICRLDICRKLRRLPTWKLLPGRDRPPPLRRRVVHVRRVARLVQSLSPRHVVGRRRRYGL
jgi:hypothetical protein